MRYHDLAQYGAKSQTGYPMSTLLETQELIITLCAGILLVLAGIAFWRLMGWLGRVLVMGLGLSAIVAALVISFGPLQSEGDVAYRIDTPAADGAGEPEPPRKDLASRGRTAPGRGATPPFDPPASGPTSTKPTAGIVPPRTPAGGGVDGVNDILGGSIPPRTPVGGAPRGVGPTRGAQPSPPETPIEPFPTDPDDTFAEVPVFFGTDRAREDDQLVATAPRTADGPPLRRVAFGSERGRRLALGQAVVSVPKTAHITGEVERPWRLTILSVTIYEEAEDPKKHFTIRSAELLSPATFFARVNARLARSRLFEDHALVFVHGYNTSFDGALYRTAQIAYDLNFDGAALLYSWPSHGSIASYEADQNSAEQARSYLKRFVEGILANTNVRHLHFVAHSMGNKPTMDVLNTLDFPAEVASDLRINQVVLAAPDVDRDVFIDLAREIVPIAKGVTLYASGKDRAMLASRAYAGGVPRAGDVFAGAPVVVDGVDTIDVSAASTDALALNHSVYAEDSALLTDIRLLLRTGKRPPPQRNTVFQKISGEIGDFWRMNTENGQQ